MKDKLRELAKDLSEKEKDNAPFERRFSEELMSILDAEGDGGALSGEVVGSLNINRYRGCDSMVNHDFDYYGNLKDGTYNLYTHPARSGVVSDEDVSIARDALMAMRDECAHDGLGPRPRIFREVRAALESYVSHHARQVPDHYVRFEGNYVRAISVADYESWAKENQPEDAYYPAQKLAAAAPAPEKD